VPQRGARRFLRRVATIHQHVEHRWLGVLPRSGRVVMQVNTSVFGLPNYIFDDRPGDRFHDERPIYSQRLSNTKAGRCITKGA
jgi:hypothetical protein